MTVCPGVPCERPAAIVVEMEDLDELLLRLCGGSGTPLARLAL